MYTVADILDHLTGMGHGSTLKRVRNIYSLMERSGSNLLARMKPLEVMRTVALESPIYDDVYNYALADDFNDLIDLIPQDNRELWDKAFRNPAGQFDLQKAIRNRTVSIEGSNGRKIIRINWRSRQGVVLNAANSYNGNGTWVASGSTTDIATDTIFFTSGGGSVKFSPQISGDGIQNTTMSPVDLTDENGVSSCFISTYLSAIPTSITAVWGNDLTTKYWTSVPVTTQADGSAFKVGWNTLKFPWATATQTGTVLPASINSFKLTFASTTVPLTNLRIDNIVFSIGRNFDMKYYSKYFFMSSDGVTWITRPVDTDDYVLCDNDSLPHFLFECLKAMAQQMEGSDGEFDIKFAEKELQELYPSYKGRNPSMVKKSVTSYGGLPRYGAASRLSGRIR